MHIGDSESVAASVPWEIPLDVKNKGTFNELKYGICKLGWEHVHSEVDPCAPNSPPGVRQMKIQLYNNTTENGSYNMKT